MKQVDFLIAGQGIAGTVFSFTALKAGYSVHVVDTPLPGMASRVAGGLINPITGRFMKKTWMADTLLPLLQQVYREMDALLGIHSFHEMPILRLMENVAESKIWEEKRQLPDYRPYMGPFITQYDEYIRPHAAAAMIEQGAWLDTSLLLTHWRRYLQNLKALSEAKLEPQEVNQHRWRNIGFKHLVYCEGWWSNANPFFPALPLSAAKGEVMVVEIPAARWNFVINKNMLIIPLGNGFFKVGATVEHTADPALLDASLQQLERKLQSVVNAPYKICSRHAGIRPTVKDRRPLLGCSSVQSNVWLLNGLGTKGVSLAPFMARHLLDHIIGGSPLMPAVDWRRFRKK